MLTEKLDVLSLLPSGVEGGTSVFQYPQVFQVALQKKVSNN